MGELAPKSKQQEERIATTVDASLKEVVGVGAKTYDKTTPLTPEQQQLVGQGYEQVKNIASMMFHMTKREILQLDDFISWGTEGLVEAAKKFDSSKSDDFLGYSRDYIRRRILDNINNSNEHISRGHFEFLKYRGRAVESATRELGRNPTEEEIAEEMGLTPKQYSKKSIRYPITTSMISLSSHEDHDSDAMTGDHFLDTLLQKANPYSPGYSEVEAEEDKIELLNKFLTQLKLTEREHQIIDMYFLKG